MSSIPPIPTSILTMNHSYAASNQPPSAPITTTTTTQPTAPEPPATPPATPENASKPPVPSLNQQKLRQKLFDGVYRTDFEGVQKILSVIREAETRGEQIRGTFLGDLGWKATARLLVLQRLGRDHEGGGSEWMRWDSEEEGMEEEGMEGEMEEDEMEEDENF